MFYLNDDMKGMGGLTFFEAVHKTIVSSVEQLADWPVEQAKQYFSFEEYDPNTCKYKINDGDFENVVTRRKNVEDFYRNGKIMLTDFTGRQGYETSNKMTQVALLQLGLDVPVGCIHCFRACDISKTAQTNMCFQARASSSVNSLPANTSKRFVNSLKW